jgi:hypothetical protein
MSFKFSTDIALIIHWLPKILSLILVLIALIIVIIYGQGSYLVGGLVIWAILFLTTLISWKIAPIGGGMFTIFASVYLLFAISSLFSVVYVLISIPLYLVGGLFILDYAYQEKLEEDEGEDDF